MASLTTRLLACATLTPFSISIAHAADVSLYGNVSKAFMGYDDGISTEATIVDNNFQSTRMGIAAEQKLDNGLTASALLEMEQNSNPSNRLTQNTTAGQSETPASIASDLHERIARVGLSNEYGAIFVGKQDIATDDTFAHDLAAAGSMINSNVASFGSGLVFRTGNGGTVSLNGTDLTPGVFALGNDGSLANANSVRLNSATYGGFNGSLSTSQGGNVDAALRYAATADAFEFDGALGHTFINNGDSTVADTASNATFASASLKHASGLAGTVAYVTNDLKNTTPGTQEPEGYYAKLGYAWNSYGIAAEYGKFKNPVASTSDHEMDVYGIGAQYDMGNGVTTGVLYRNFSADVAGIADIKDINVVTVALGIKF